MQIPDFVCRYHLLDTIFSREGTDTSIFPHTDLTNTLSFSPAPEEKN